MRVLAAAVLALCVVPAYADDATAGAGEALPAPARRPLLGEQPSAFQWSLHADTESVSTLDGGARRGSVFDTVLHAALAADTRPLGLWNGGRLAASAVHISSGRPSARYVGALQSVSNFEAEPAARLYQLWYRQQFDASGLRLKGGLIDLNEDFAAVETAGALVNASFGVMPAMSANFPVSSYPEPGFGLEAGVARRRWSYRVGLFEPNPANRSELFENGRLLIGEAGYQPAAQGGPRGHYKLGVWQYRQSDPALVGVPREDWGVYAIADQARFSHGRLAAFLQAGAAPRSSSAVPFYLGGGLQLRQPFGAHDVLAGAVAHARMRDRAAPAETVFELSYIVRIHRYVIVQGDLQYVDHPDGRTDVANASVALVRLHFEFY